MEVRREHFYAKSAYKKKELRDKDAKLRTELSKLLQDNDEFAPEDAIQFSQWNPYDQNASSPFFDPEWMFGLEEGFDLVIGNPPYVQLQKKVAGWLNCINIANIKPSLKREISIHCFMNVVGNY